MAVIVDGPEFFVSDGDLVYAATRRCACGEGLAYVRDAGLAWDCAGLLCGRALPYGIAGAVEHDNPIPLGARVFPESVDRGTTRPAR